MQPNLLCFSYTRLTSMSVIWCSMMAHYGSSEQEVKLEFSYETNISLRYLDSIKDCHTSDLVECAKSRHNFHNCTPEFFCQGTTIVRVWKA